MQSIGRAVLAAAGLLLLASAAGAQGARPLTRCPADAVISGTACMDRYEASVYRVNDPAGEGAGVLKRILGNKITADDLAAFTMDGLVERLGDGDDYGACLDDGQDCGDIFAVSLPGVAPSSHATWFQAQQACKNSRKRLPTNAEWQAAVSGTPDSPDSGVEQCNMALPGGVEATGNRELCFSDDGAYDMVGNLAEWVADFVPLSTDCGEWPASISANDDQCLAGASALMTDEPGALVRGGDFDDNNKAGPFAVNGAVEPSTASAQIGFRCVR